MTEKELEIVEILKSTEARIPHLQTALEFELQKCKDHVEKNYRLRKTLELPEAKRTPEEANELYLVVKDLNFFQVRPETN